jgi:hypothetical protein
MAGAALVVSIVALVVSGLAYWRQVKWARVAAEAQARLAEIEAERHTVDLTEQQRARLSVVFEPVGTDSHMLVIRNNGPATARDVTIDLESRAPGDAPGFRDSPFPATIPAGADAAAHLDESLATATLLTGTLQWTDDTGDNEEARDLTIR